jgi:serine/threonine-protein kinase HipA
MSGNEHELDVYLGKDKIAKLSLINDQLHWHYSSLWEKSGYPVSPHLPLTGKIPPLNVQRFIRNLLPEGNGLEELIHTFHLSRYNTFGLIRALGLDTSGALTILSPEQTFPQAPSFRPLSEQELETRLNDRDIFSLIIWDGKPRLSVAGVQDKINIVVTENGELGFGDGTLCSTHILKFEKQKLAHLALNEYTTMCLAHQCGLHVANVKLVRYGQHPALLVERFDRHFTSITEVKRRHIIDGCQALNVSPDYKYERNFGSGRDVAHIRDGVSLIKLFEFANQCENPALTKQQILDWVLFNALIFNCDAHGKNISFFVGANGITLAPFYDLVNIQMYPEFEHEMAMGLGDEFDGHCVNANQLADFADSCQLSRQLVARRLRFLINKIKMALKDCISTSMDDEEQTYLKDYQKIIEKRCVHLLHEADGIVSFSL